MFYVLFFFSVFVHVIALSGMDNEQIISKLRPMWDMSSIKIDFIDTNGQTYFVRHSIHDIKKNNYKCFYISKKGESKGQLIHVFLSDDPFHTVDSLKNTAEGIILFYPTNFDLFIPFLNELYPYLSHSLSTCKAELDYLCPKKQFFLVEYVFGSGYFKRQISFRCKCILQSGKNQTITAVNQLMLFLNDAYIQKMMNRIYFFLGGLIGIICMKKSAISYKKGVSVGMLYILIGLYYTN